MVAFEFQEWPLNDKNVTKNCQKLDFWQIFVTFFALKCFKNVSPLDQKSVKNVAKRMFCHIFVRFNFRMFPQCFISCIKMWQKCVKSNVFDRFLWHFWKKFCQNWNTFLNLIDFCHIFRQFLLLFCHILVFDSFLSVFWQFIVTFLHFVTFLSVFCYIFVTFTKNRDQH